MELVKKSSTSTDPLVEIVEGIHASMLLAYGRKYTDMWGSSTADDLIEFWVEGLRGFTPREVKHGITAMASCDWPPTLPEFRKLCRPPVSDTAAYYEAMAGLLARAKGEFGDWSSPAVFWAASHLKVELMSQSYTQIKDRWNALLKAQIERGEWAEIPMPRALLPAPEVSPAAREHADAMIKKLGADGIFNKPWRNPLAWAEKIMDRVKRGDKSLVMIQIKFAKTALGIKDEVEA